MDFYPQSKESFDRLMRMYHAIEDVIRHEPFAEDKIKAAQIAAWTYVQRHPNDDVLDAALEAQTPRAIHRRLAS